MLFNMMKIRFQYPFSLFCSPLHTCNQQFNLYDAFACIQNVDEAQSLFHYMLQLKPRPYIDQYHKLLTIIVKMKQYPLAITLFKKMLLTWCPVNQYFMNSVIHCYSQINRVDLSFPVIATFLKRGFSPDAVTYNSLIRGFFLQGKVVEAVTLYKNLVQSDFEITEFTINIVLDGLCKSGELDAACQLLGLAEINNWKLDEVAYNSIMNGLCKSRMLGDAMRLLSRMLDRDVLPGIVTYTTLLHGLCDHNRFDLAYRLFNDLPSKGVDPDLVTYNVMIQGLCYRREFQVAKRTLEYMEKLGLVADNITYNIILDACIRHCYDFHSIDLLKQIVGRDFQLSASTFFVLLGGISTIRQMYGIYDDEIIMQLMLKLVSSDNVHTTPARDREMVNSLIQKVFVS